MCVADLWVQYAMKVNRGFDGPRIPQPVPPGWQKGKVSFRFCD